MRPSRGILAVVVLLLGSVGLAAPAQSADTVLCKGFAQCGKAPYGTFAYSSGNWKKSHWSQQARHNCTNYVAYRLIQRGKSIAQPIGTLDGRGAHGWVDAARAAGVKVSSTPQVGDVAWWPRGYQGADKKTGHVAIVESIEPDGSFKVSEDNAGGDFRWRQIGKPSSSSKLRFIRFTGGDGSVFGKVTVSWPKTNTVKVSGYLRDPDDPDGALDLKVQVAGRTLLPPKDKPIRSMKFSVNWSQSSLRGPRAVTLTVKNKKGPGGDFVRRVDKSAISGRFLDASITKSQAPKFSFNLAPTTARGTVTFWRGSKLLRTTKVKTGGKKVTVTLPKQKKGKHTIAVRFAGDPEHFAAKKSFKLSVR